MIDNKCSICVTISIFYCSFRKRNIFFVTFVGEPRCRRRRGKVGAGGGSRVAEEVEEERGKLFIALSVISTAGNSRKRSLHLFSMRACSSVSQAE